MRKGPLLAIGALSVLTIWCSSIDSLKPDRLSDQGSSVEFSVSKIRTMIEAVIQKKTGWFLLTSAQAWMLYNEVYKAASESHSSEEDWSCAETVVSSSSSITIIDVKCDWKIETIAYSDISEDSDSKYSYVSTTKLYSETLWKPINQIYSNWRESLSIILNKND